MSLSRLALRLAAVEALCPAASIASGPYPTVAGPRVDDSRIDLIAAAESPEELAAALSVLENKPLIVVYTEEHGTMPYGDGQFKYPAAENTVTLVIEAMIAGTGVMNVELPDGTIQSIGTLEAPVTDRQHEAVLDVLEAQVCYIFDGINRVPSAFLFRKVAMEVRMIHSDPQRASDRTLRLASRTIKFHIKVKETAWPQVPVLPTPTGFDLLPEPLRTIAKGLRPGSSGAVLCTSIIPLMPGAAALPPALTDVDISQLNFTGVAFGTMAATEAPDIAHFTQ